MLYVMCLCDTVVIKWCNMENGVMWLTKVMVELMSAELQHVYLLDSLTHLCSHMIGWRSARRGTPLAQW